MARREVDYVTGMDDVTGPRDSLQMSLEASLSLPAGEGAGSAGCCTCCYGNQEEDVNPDYERQEERLSVNSLRIRPGVDGRWAWLVAVCACINAIAIDGIGFSGGILYMNLVDTKFVEDEAKAALVNSVNFGVYLGSAPFASILAERFGYRPVGFVGAILGGVGYLGASFTPPGYLWMMILLYGVVGGLGMGLLYLTSMVTTALYFEKHRPLALGLVTSGSGIGLVLFGLISGPIYSAIKWPGMMRVQAGMITIGVLTSLSFRPILNEQDDKFIRVLQTRIKSLSRLPGFWILLLLTFSATIGLFCNFAFLPTLATDERNIYNPSPDYFISIIGGVSILFRFIIAGVVQTRKVSPLIILSACHVMGGIVMTCNSLYTTYTSLAIMSAVIGVTYAADASLSQEIIAGSLGRRYLSVAFGIICVFRGAAGLISPPLLVLTVFASLVVLMVTTCNIPTPYKARGPPVEISKADPSLGVGLSFDVAGAMLILTSILCIVMLLVSRSGREEYRPIREGNEGDKERTAINRGACPQSPQYGTANPAYT